MNNHHRLLPATPSLVLLLFAVVLSLLWAAESLVAQPPAAAEIYQDFRNKRPISDAFRLGGFDPESEIKTENEGLRITLPAERGQHFLSEINANIVIAGDFEFTATYEILSAAAPLMGYGVGVNLTVSTAEPSKKFGKLCRVLRPKEGSVYLAESWPKYQMRTSDTEAMTGQLRLARIGAALVFLVSDGAGQEFQQIWEIADYGRDDIGYAGFQVSDSGEPGNPVDVRLIDLRLRLGKMERDKVTAPASLAAPAPPDRDAWDDLPRWLIALVLVGVGTLFFLIIAVAVRAKFLS
jgi:hypothetical protein